MCVNPHDCGLICEAESHFPAWFECGTVPVQLMCSSPDKKMARVGRDGPKINTVWVCASHLWARLSASAQQYDDKLITRCEDRFFTPNPILTNRLRVGYSANTLVTTTAVKISFNVTTSGNTSSTWQKHSLWHYSILFRAIPPFANMSAYSNGKLVLNKGLKQAYRKIWIFMSHLIHSFIQNDTSVLSAKFDVYVIVTLLNHTEFTDVIQFQHKSWLPEFSTIQSHSFLDSCQDTDGRTDGRRSWLHSQFCTSQLAAPDTRAHWKLKTSQAEDCLPQSSVRRSIQRTTGWLANAQISTVICLGEVGLSQKIHTFNAQFQVNHLLIYPVNARNISLLHTRATDKILKCFNIDLSYKII